MLALDTVFNREVLGNTGRFFPRDAGALGSLLDALDIDADQVARMRTRAAVRVAERYTWDGVAEQYERLFLEVCSVGRG